MIPRRHGADLAAARRISGPLRWFIRGNPEPTPERWRALGEALLQGDPPADQLVEWMYSAGMGHAMPLFQRALNQGVASVPDAPPPLREFFGQCERRPEWVDERLLAEGARVSQLIGLTGNYVLRDFALMGGYQASALNKTLLLSGALEGGTRRRVAETMKWWVNCTADGGMARFGDGFKSTLHVRLMHALIRRRVSRLPVWDIGASGLPVNQTDMAATYLGFSVVLLFGVRAMGVPITRQESRAAMHFWSYVCWLMGVEERWLANSEMAGRVLLYQVALAQTPPDESSKQLGRALMEESRHVPYRRFRSLRGRFEQARHLSVTRFFVGRRGMQALGLPATVLPWFPLISAPFILVWHLVHRLLPGGRERLIRAGRKAQENLVKTHFGQETAEVGALHAT